MQGNAHQISTLRISNIAIAFLALSKNRPVTFLNEKNFYLYLKIVAILLR